MKYFRNITTAEEIKKQFRTYCVSMHPDKGGDPEEFKAMMAEYQKAMKNAGAWTKDAEKEAEGIRRGSVVVSVWGPNCKTNYVVLSVHGENIEVVRIFSRNCKSLEDAVYYLGDENNSIRSRETFGKYDHIRPLSKKFGCGLYWDDVTNKIYTEKEILEIEQRANNFDVWAKNWKADREEKERIAQEEADRKENAIIAQWSGILEELPPTFKGKTGADWYAMTREERKAQDKAERSANAKRLAAFKRNVKAVFAHFWPGVKVTVSDTSKTYLESSVISWVDGPTIAEVEKCEVFRYFLGVVYTCDPYADYGSDETIDSMRRFRELFGSFSDSEINYRRSFSDATMAKVRQTLADKFPEIKKGFEAGEQGFNFVFSTDGLNSDFSKLEKLCGFQSVECPNWDTATDEEKEAYFKANRPLQDFANEITRCICSDGKMFYSILLKILYKYYKLETEQPQQQTEKKAKAARNHEAAKDEKAAEGVDMTAAPAEGLELVEIAEGVAIVGDQRTTYKNRKQIKAHGARWNKDAQQWQATTAEAVAALREWFGMTEQAAQDGAQSEGSTEAVEDTEDVTKEPQSATDTAESADTREQVEAVGALASALSFLLNAVISASKEAKAAADQAAASAAAATAHDAAEEREQKRKEAAAILREQIAKVSEQVANLSGTLSQMLERLNALESGQDVSEEAAAEPQPETTAQDGATAQQSGRTSTRSADSSTSDRSRPTAAA